MSVAANLSWAVGKVGDIGTLQREWLAANELGIAGRARLMVDGARAIVGNKRVVPYFGRQLHYDHRLQPAMLPIHMSDIRRLDALIGLDGKTVLDVGANIGQFGATLKWRFPHGRVWSFEPNPHIYPILERNAAQSDGWMLVPWGLAASDADHKFWFVEGKSGQGSIYRDNAVSRLRESETTEVDVSLRELTPERMRSFGIPDTVDLVKVDVEGAEREVLRGLSHVRWRYLTVELSLERTGSLTAEAATQLIRETWDAEPVLVWQGDTSPDAPYREAIFAIA